MIVPAPGETLSLVDLYKLNYRKETNSRRTTGAISSALTTALAKGQSGATTTTPATLRRRLSSPASQAVADVAQWMRWFAVNSFADNEETNLSNGDGDDYTFYFGETDPRARLLSLRSRHDPRAAARTSNVATHGIFRMVDCAGRRARRR